MSNTPPHPGPQPIFSIFGTPPSNAAPWNPDIAGPAAPRTEAGSGERSAGSEKVKSRSAPLLQDRQARGKEPRTGRAVGQGGEDGEEEGEGDGEKRM